MLNLRLRNVSLRTVPEPKSEIPGFMSKLILSKIFAVMVAATVVAADPIIVVGGGLAGLSATLEIVDSGRSVILVEGEASTGGNSAKASSGINGAGTDTQKAMGLEDTPQNLVRDTLNAGDDENDKELVAILADKSAEAVQFLKKLDVDLNDVNLCGGHSVARTHWIPSPKEGRPIPVGFEIMKKLRARLMNYLETKPENVLLMENTRMVGILEENSKIVGISIETKEGHREVLRGSAVILATGGFSADRTENGLVETYGKEKLSFPSTNGAFARGDGVKLAKTVGAKTIGMDRIQIHPTAFVDSKDPAAATKFLAAEALRGKGAILVTPQGKRFGNELGRRDYLTQRILQESAPVAKDFQSGSAGRHSAIMLMNEKHIEAFGRPAFNFYAIVKKFFVKYENVGELAKAMNLDVAVLKSTFEEYKKHFETKEEDDFGKKIFPVAPFEDDETVYAAIVTPAIHYTMGGLKVDGSARVLNEQDVPIEGLYAAGEVAGGVHGANRLAGNSLLECVVFGRIAGQTAAKSIEPKSEL